MAALADFVEDTVQKSRTCCREACYAILCYAMLMFHGSLLGSRMQRSCDQNHKELNGEYGSSRVRKQADGRQLLTRVIST